MARLGIPVTANSPAQLIGFADVKGPMALVQEVINSGVSRNRVEEVFAPKSEQRIFVGEFDLRHEVP